MFIAKKKYLVKKLIANQRIEYLEKQICPNGHDYKKIDDSIYCCSKCRKIKKVLDI